MKKQAIFVGRGLSHKAALERARKKAKHDFRGMKYDPKTGWADLI